MAAKFEIKKATNGQYFFHLKSANGEIILASERYEEKGGARTGIASYARMRRWTNVMSGRSRTTASTCST